MLKREAKSIKAKIGEIEFTVIFSGRRTLGISVLPDSTVLVRVPFKTAHSSIEKIVKKKYGWIKKHRDNFLRQKEEKPSRCYANGHKHFFRGNEFLLNIESSNRSAISFNEGIIQMSIKDPDDQDAVRELLYRGYRVEAEKLFPDLFKQTLEKYKGYDFRPSSLVIRTMRRRWGSCSSKGKITLSTELIKLSDIYKEYVITHELCHLRHHNHGEKFYALLSDIFPDWKKYRTEMKRLHI
jgi:predicted metal-dependent hydrolase